MSKREKEKVDPADQLDIAFSILHYNQSLIQFADSKANALLLINSIFIASLSSFIPAIKAGDSSFMYTIFLIFMVSCVISLLLALGVILTRTGTNNNIQPPSSIFYFGHIAAHSCADGYVSEFSEAEIHRVCDSTLANVYTLANIAKAKFTIYNIGQTATMISCSFWVVTMLMLFFS